MIKGYRVLYAPYPPRAPPPASAPPRARVSAVIGTSSAVTGLAAATNYSVQVLAYTAAGDGPLSAPVSCTTEPDGEHHSALKCRRLSLSGLCKYVQTEHRYSTDIYIDVEGMTHDHMLLSASGFRKVFIFKIFLDGE